VAARAQLASLQQVVGQEARVGLDPHRVGGCCGGGCGPGCDNDSGGEEGA